jgi:uncharacterized DUF497 family protein
MEFDWDPRKAEENLKRHGVSFDEARTVFGDPLAKTFYDPKHSENEERYISMGMSVQGRTLFVNHTDRGDKTRIISARLVTKTERKGYEEEWT